MKSSSDQLRVKWPEFKFFFCGFFHAALGLIPLHSSVCVNLVVCPDKLQKNRENEAVTQKPHLIPAQPQHSALSSDPSVTKHTVFLLFHSELLPTNCQSPAAGAADPACRLRCRPPQAAKPISAWLSAAELLFKFPNTVFHFLLPVTTKQSRPLTRVCAGRAERTCCRKSQRCAYSFVPRLSKSDSGCVGASTFHREDVTITVSQLRHRWPSSAVNSLQQHAICFIVMWWDIQLCTIQKLLEIPFLWSSFSTLTSVGVEESRPLTPLQREAHIVASLLHTKHQAAFCHLVTH